MEVLLQILQGKGIMSSAVTMFHNDRPVTKAPGRDRALHIICTQEYFSSAYYIYLNKETYLGLERPEGNKCPNLNMCIMG